MHFKFTPMSTFLFDDIVFGPVQSRRLGVSLGINLLPVNAKVCSFDCIYCECGWTDKGEKVGVLPKREQIAERLESILLERKQNGLGIDAITFAGNGEPTLHPQFADIVDDTIKLRHKYFPNARISVLSNATMINRSKVFYALQKVDDNILKLDSAIQSTVELINCPLGSFNMSELIQSLMQFSGNLTIQTMFIRGEYNGKSFDNTALHEIESWLEALKKIKPKMVMIYSIARDTPAQGIEKVTRNELGEIATRVRELGFNVQVSS